VTERHEQLLQAIAGNDAFRVGALLSEDPGLVRARDSQGRTPILFALYLGHEPLAHLIRERAPKPTLFEAAALGEKELVETLLEGSPDLANAMAKDGFCPLALAVYFGRTEVAELLLKAGASPDTPSNNEFKVRPIHSAAAHRNPEVSLALVRLLLEWKAEPNVAQAGGWTPLHQAAAQGRLETASLLLAHGASPNAKTDDGRTPLEMARLKKHADVEGLLSGEGE
jgi:ankyrin repeat protein